MAHGIEDRLKTAVLGRTSTRVRKIRRLRRPAIVAYRAFARLALTGPEPKVLANSIPKAGTHLLMQVLGSVPSLWFSGVHVDDSDFAPVGPLWSQLFDEDKFDAVLSRLRRGQFMTCHLSFVPTAERRIADSGAAHLLLVRDPRDVALSRAFYLASRPDIAQRSGFERLQTLDERLRVSLTGVKGPDDRWLLAPVAELYRGFAGWLERPDVCVVRFEDLVGERGGGSRVAQLQAIERILQACQRDASPATVDRLAAAAFATHTATFRRGAIGDWRNHFSAEHRALFEDMAGELINRFSYG